MQIDKSKPEWWRPLTKEDGFASYPYEISNWGRIKSHWGANILKASDTHDTEEDGRITIRLCSTRDYHKRVTLKHLRQLKWPEIFGDSLVQQAQSKPRQDRPETMARLRKQTSNLKQRVAELEEERNQLIVAILQLTRAHENLQAEYQQLYSLYEPTEETKNANTAH